MQFRLRAAVHIQIAVGVQIANAVVELQAAFRIIDALNDPLLCVVAAVTTVQAELTVISFAIGGVVLNV